MVPRGSMYTTIMDFGPQNHKNGLSFGTYFHYGSVYGPSGVGWYNPQNVKGYLCGNRGSGTKYYLRTGAAILPTASDVDGGFCKGPVRL